MRQSALTPTPPHLRDFVFPQFQHRRYLEDIIFIHDGAPFHINRRVKQFLRQQFTDALMIGRHFLTIWFLAEMGNMHQKKYIIYNIQILTDFCSKYTIFIYFENFGKCTIYSCFKKYIQHNFRICLKNY